MRYPFLTAVLISGWSIFATASIAFEVEDRARFGPEDAPKVLRILSTADISFFEPMILSYLRETPDVAIDYTVASSTEVMRAIHDEKQPFDVAISSAMDLNTKLANDGHAMRHASLATQSLPEWAAWNDMLFAFTEEPAAIVVSKAAFGDLAIPRDRHELIALLRREPERFRGRVGTYDVRHSGLGYLFATQDTRASETFWRLAEVMGALDVQLYCCSSDMIEAITHGDLLIAYNVLGSYAANHADKARFEIVLPSDFTTVMLRTALIPVYAPSPELAQNFVDHVLTRSHGPEAERLVHLGLDSPPVDASLNRVQIGPGLMVFLDQLKRLAFVREWESAMVQNQ